MLDENVLIVDIDPDHWTRLFTLFEETKKNRPSILLLMEDGGECLKALRLGKGAILNFDPGNWNLADIAQREGVDYVGRIQRHFFQEAFAAGQAEVDFDADYIEQLLSIYNDTIAYTSENIQWYPQRPTIFPNVSYEKVQKVFNKILPDGRTFFFCITEKGLPYTSLILGKRSGDISLITTLDALERAHSPFDMEKDLDEILVEIEDRFEKVGPAFVMERRAFLEMLAGQRPVTYFCASMKHRRAALRPFTFKTRLVFWYARTFKRL